MVPRFALSCKSSLTSLRRHWRSSKQYFHDRSSPSEIAMTLILKARDELGWEGSSKTVIIRVWESESQPQAEPANEWLRFGVPRSNWLHDSNSPDCRQKTFNTPLKSDIYLKLRLSRYLSFRDQDMYDYRRQPCRPNSIICKPRVLSNEFADSSSLCRPSTFIIENSEAALAESPIEMSYKAPCSKVYDIKASGRG